MFSGHTTILKTSGVMHELVVKQGSPLALTRKILDRVRLIFGNTLQKLTDNVQKSKNQLDLDAFCCETT